MARKLRSDEREAVNRQLPASKKRNLGGQSLKVAREDLARTPLGAPPVDYDVRSTYDVRPIAAFDFNICNSQLFDSLGTPRLVEMTVPQGLVCVLRKLDLWFEPNPVGALRSAYNWSLSLNGANVNYNENVLMGVASDDEIVFLLADEFNRVGVRFGAVLASNLENIRGFVRFYGTFQLKSEIPLPFEIANPTGRIRSRAVARVGVPPIRETPREPSAPVKSVAPQSQKQPTPAIVQAVAELQPKKILQPPFIIKLSRNLVRGVMTLVPVKPKGGGFVLLTPQELTTYAEYIATLK